MGSTVVTQSVTTANGRFRGDVAGGMQPDLKSMANQTTVVIAVEVQFFDGAVSTVMLRQKV